MADSTRDRLADALATIVREDQTAMVTKWVCVMEVIGENGVPELWSMNSEGLSMWDQKGMLLFRQEMLIPQPPTEEDEDG